MPSPASLAAGTSLALALPTAEPTTSPLPLPGTLFIRIVGRRRIFALVGRLVRVTVEGFEALLVESLANTAEGGFTGTIAEPFVDSVVGTWVGTGFVLMAERGEIYPFVLFETIDLRKHHKV